MKSFKMEKSWKFSPNGIDAVEYKAGETYDVNDRAAELCEAHGFGKAVAASKKTKEKDGKDKK